MQCSPTLVKCLPSSLPRGGGGMVVYMLKSSNGMSVGGVSQPNGSVKCVSGPPARPAVTTA